ncbi:hypothetical protein KBY55_09520 [Streptomyces sp. b94]|uniref:hypothetical protein n=1 Tax=Streptomyces sp. b94 TaxID=1827634 RepID=UPI001B36E5B0|nr:hypothetical protein [Streptomyces sp. b94]MBQ1096322.1 hypothetical protein [Streptomyces sp. b94]
MGPADLGDVPTWIGGAGALTAGWFAYQTIKSQRQQIGEQQAFIAEQTRFMDEQRQNLELERAELRAAAEDRRWAQARQVQMTASWEHDSEASTVDAPEGQYHGRAVLKNLSEAPVTDVEVRYGEGIRTAEIYDWREDQRYRRGARWTTEVQLLGPGRAVLFLSSHVSLETVRERGGIEMRFTDADGVRWLLGADGKLEEVQADGAS